jgi:hypothetical protein
MVGFTIFLLLLLLAVQVLVRLYATSALTAAAFDAARDVASAPTDQAAALAAAETDARQRLGSFGSSRTSFRWKEVDAHQVVLEIRGRSPGFLPLPSSFRTIVRTVTVRTERFR